MTEEQKRIRGEMERLLRDCPGAFGEVMEHLLRGSGKNLRGALTLICAEAPAAKRQGRGEREKRRERALRLAAVIEILHMATLVHDDVIDDSPLRRGLPSVQGRFGRKVAVTTGDYLFTVCFEGVMDQGLDQMRILSRSMSKICAGEMMQLRHNRDCALTLRQYLRIIGRKTGVLFSCAAASGAHAAGADDHTMRALSVYAMYLGMVFQIADDCLDFTGRADTLQKPALGDARAGVVTLPLLYALEREPKEELARAITQPNGEEELELIRRRVEEARGVDRALELARRYRDKGARKLDRLGDFPRKDELYTLLDQALHRSK